MIGSEWKRKVILISSGIEVAAGLMPLKTIPANVIAKLVSFLAYFKKTVSFSKDNTEKVIKNLNNRQSIKGGRLKNSIARNKTHHFHHYNP